MKDDDTFQTDNLSTPPGVSLIYFFALGVISTIPVTIYLGRTVSLESVDILDSVLSNQSLLCSRTTSTSYSSLPLGGVGGFDDTELVGDGSSSLSSTSGSFVIGFSTAT